MRLGLRMVQFMMATLVHAFDWRLGEAARKLDMEEAYGLTLRRATPLVAISVPRLTSQPGFDALQRSLLLKNCSLHQLWFS
ncbi:Flavonoid 3'-monooxygenase [Platanthera guangdongensis]|uniref:Flavonoid 3'-monooxygenase n=1 Tax=Platanthera guangdongensis TaxID=2320717 RepID=A0ABR2N5L8_9ASPA